MKSDNSLFKFFIGFAAGAVAAVFPRVAAAIGSTAAPDGVGISSFLNLDYLALCLLFSLMIGVVVMILEWRVPKEPGNTLMMALGIPALLSGAFNTTAGANSYVSVLEQSSRLETKLTEALSEKANIPIYRYRPKATQPRRGESEGRTHILNLSWVAVAHAQERARQLNPDQRPKGFNPWIQVPIPPLYYVVLDTAETVAAAHKKAKGLAYRFPNASAQVLSIDQGILIYDESRLLSESEALLAALQLRTEEDLNPGILDSREVDLAPPPPPHGLPVQ